MPWRASGKAVLENEHAMLFHSGKRLAFFVLERKG